MNLLSDIKEEYIKQATEHGLHLNYGLRTPEEYAIYMIEKMDSAELLVKISACLEKKGIYI